MKIRLCNNLEKNVLAEMVGCEREAKKIFSEMKLSFLEIYDK